MKLAVIGSRGLNVDRILEDCIPAGVTELVSGGAKGVDSCVQAYANARGIPIKVFLPDYARFGRAAPLKRNVEIVEYADAVLAFWDGTSKGTAYTVRQAEKSGKKATVVYLPRR